MNVIYLMTDTINNLRYIGSKVNWKGIGSYFGSPSSLNEDNPKYELQLKYKETVKNSPEKIEVEILEIVEDRNDLLVREKFWQKQYNAIQSNEFINASYAGFSFGGPHTLETKEKMSNSQKEHYANSNRAEEVSEQFRKTINALNLETNIVERVNIDLIDGIKYEVYLKGERHPMYGKTHTEEAKQKIREANYNYNWTDEHKANHSKKLKGRTFSDEHKENLRKANTGSNNPCFGNIPWNRKLEIFGETRTAKEWQNYFSLSKLSELKTYLINNRISYE